MTPLYAGNRSDYRFTNDPALSVAVDDLRCGMGAVALTEPGHVGAKECAASWHAVRKS